MNYWRRLVRLKGQNPLLTEPRKAWAKHRKLEFGIGSCCGRSPDRPQQDVRPWTPTLRAECEALSLLYFLRDQSQPQSEWLNAISSDQTLSEAVRQRALQFAREWK